MNNVEKVVQFYKEYPGHFKTASADIADRLGVSYDDVMEARDEFRKIKKNTEYKTRQDFNKKAEQHDVKDEYEEFLNKHNIDPDDVVQVYYKGKTSGTNFTVQTRFDKQEIEFDPAKAFREAIQEYSPPNYSEQIFKQKDHKQRAAVINLFDAHLDKIASLSDTDQKADIDTNIANFETAFNDLLQSIVAKQPEIILFPVGNDFWHTNDATLSTKKGTDLSDSVHVTGMKAFRLGLNLIRRCIDKARQICNVFIIPVKGNHDEDRVNYLLECLLIAYENQSDVGILDSNKSRLYYRYGSYLFGFAHGDKQRKAKDLPSLMATDKDSRQHWSEIDKGIYFLGDIHHEKKYDYMMSKDFRGCKVMFLRSTSPVDEWHWSKGFTAIPSTAYAFLYDKDGTREQEFKVNIN